MTPKKSPAPCSGPGDFQRDAEPRLAGANVDRLGAFATLSRLKFDRLPVAKGLEAGAYDIREVDEQVAASVIVGDKSVAFRLVEPLYDTGSQWLAPFSFIQVSSFKLGREPATLITHFKPSLECSRAGLSRMHA